MISFSHNIPSSAPNPAACGRALEIGARSFTSVNSILKNNLEAKRPAPAADGPSIAHPNIRGPVTSIEENTTDANPSHP